MVAARMLRPSDGGIDSLGIALFRSTLASNRKDENEILLGPSGGCALLTRRLLEDLSATHGEWFDESFSATPKIPISPSARAGSAIARRMRPRRRSGIRGSLSSGGPDNDFVLYHGIRNSLWWLVKDAPAGWLIRSLPWFIALHAAIWLRHLRRGRARVLWRLYRDAIKGIPAMRRKRAIVRASRRVPASEFATMGDAEILRGRISAARVVGVVARTAARSIRITETTHERFEEPVGQFDLALAQIRSPASRPNCPACPM